MSAATTYINGLLYDARCFRCLPEATHFEIQTYILSVIAGGSTDPAVLVNQARGLAALSWQSLTEIKVFLLATLAGFDTTPNKLVTGAKCYDCIPPGMLTEVQTYLLAQDPAGPGITGPNALAQAAKAFQSLDPHDLLQIQVMLLALMANLTVDSSALIQAAKCMTCFPYTVLIAVEVSTLDFLEPIPGGSARTGLPPPNPPPPPPGGPPPGRGGGVPGGCTDTIANLTPVITAHYVAGAITTIDILVPRTCCKKSSFELFGSNAANMSGAVLVTGGSNPNKTVNWTTTGIDVSGAGFSFYAAQSVCVGGLTSPFSNIVSAVNAGDTWAQRVVLNGGAAPSAPTISAINTFVSTLNAAGIWSKMIHVNVIAPDSMIAFRTPLIVGTGNDPWQLVTGGGDTWSLTVDGIQRTAGTAAWDTGIIPTAAYADNNNAGISSYKFTNGAETIVSAGVGQVFNDSTQPSMFVFNGDGSSNRGTLMWDVASMARVASGTAGGFVSGSRVNANDHRAYFASSITAFSQIAFSAVASVGRPNRTLYYYGWNNGGTLVTNSLRHSFFALHLGLTAAETQALYNAVQALRTAFGGGFV